MIILTDQTTCIHLSLLSWVSAIRQVRYCSEEAAHQLRRCSWKIDSQEKYKILKSKLTLFAFEESEIWIAPAD